ncbi:MAG: hypothetical protein HKO97_13630 [Flavobacteriaceae bacterium]|nr:hypothetical protein [Flavobacteriaceae bacterium]
MKTFISMLVVGMISFLSFAQESHNQTSMVELEDVVVLAVNTSYLATVQDENTPKEVTLLQRDAANFDIRSNPDFSEDVTTDTFEMVFRNSKGSIDTFYNKHGKIEASYERFRNILLPRAIQRQLYQSHQGWTMTGNLYASAYENDDLIDRSYKIQLEKGDDKKSVVIHVKR